MIQEIMLNWKDVLIIWFLPFQNQNITFHINPTNKKLEKVSLELPGPLIDSRVFYFDFK